MKFGALLSKGIVRPYDRLVVKKLRFDYKVLDIYDGEYAYWTSLSHYLEQDAIVVCKAYKDEKSKEVRILLT